MATQSNPRETLFRQDLDASKCMNPNCTDDHPIFITAVCHIGSSVNACYIKEEGCLMFHCGVCNTFICCVQVGEAIVN